jgi:hypothetical protein
VLIEPLLQPGTGVAYVLLLEDNKPKEVASVLLTHGLRGHSIKSKRAQNELLHVYKFFWR